MKPLALFLVLASLVSLASAQSSLFEQPYAVTSEGFFQGVVWKARRNQEADTMDVHKKTVLFTVGLFGNDPFYGSVLTNHRPSGRVASFTMSALRSVQGGGIQIPQVDSSLYGAKTGFKAEKITFGGGTTASKESRGITVEGECVDMKPSATVVTREMVTTVKRQKLWTCSNFRITVGGAVIDDAISFDPIQAEYAPFGDLDGDGIVDEGLRGDSFVLEIPRFSKYGSSVFEPALASTLNGSPKLLPARVEYLDEDGLTVLSLSFLVTVAEMGPADLFFDPNAASNNVRVVAKIKRDLAIEMERRSGGF